MLTRSTRARFVAWAAAVAVTAGLIAVDSTPTAAVTAETPSGAVTAEIPSAPAAAGWLARKLVDGERFDLPGTTYADPGLTVDALLAFAAAGVSGTNLRKMIDWLSDPAVADGYFGDFDADPTTATPGSLGKLILVAEVAGEDPTNFAGTDLIALLLTLQDASTGRFIDNAGWSEYDNALGEAFAVIALARTGSHEAAVGVGAGFLASIQCSDGGFPLSLPPLESGTGTPACDSQVDATAVVTQALLAAGDTANAGEGLDWLASEQKSNGGFSDDAAANTAPVNANSTGLAAQALRVAGDDAAADRAVAYLASLQVGCDGSAARRGAIAYDATGFDADAAGRATPQAILGLAGIGYLDLSAEGIAADAPSLDCPVPPATGAPLTPILIGGAGLVLAGAVLVLVVRRRPRPAAS